MSKKKPQPAEPPKIKKGDWCRWSGRQHKVVNEQAKRYDAPIGGPTIDVAELAQWLHDFLAENALRLRDGGDSEISQTELDRAKLRQSTARADALELANEVRRGELVPREHVRRGFEVIAAQFRELGDKLGRQLSKKPADKAHQLLESTWSEVATALQRYFDVELENDPTDLGRKQRG